MCILLPGVQRNAAFPCLVLGSCHRKNTGFLDYSIRFPVVHKIIRYAVDRHSTRWGGMVLVPCIASGEGVPVGGTSVGTLSSHTAKNKEMKTRSLAYIPHPYTYTMNSTTFPPPSK